MDGEYTQEEIDRFNKAADTQDKLEMEGLLWRFINTAAANPRVKPDPRIWEHVLTYAPKEVKDMLDFGILNNLGR